MIAAWLFSTPTSAQVVISEVQSANHQTLIELDGEAHDWIELTNQGLQAIDLAGWGLSDSSNSPHKWLFGDVLIAPGEHLILRASGQNSGVLVDTLSYTDHSPWTFAYDGTGRSLELIDPTSDNAEASSWGASRAPLGTPGELNSLSTP